MSNNNGYLEEINKIRKLIVDGDAILVLGAGASLASTDQNDVASFIGLLRSGTDFCRRNLIDVSYDASEVRDSMTPEVLVNMADSLKHALITSQKMEQFLEEKYRTLINTYPEYARSFRDWKIPIITTNFDDLLEQALDYSAVTWEDAPSSFDILTYKSDGIIHLHGVWSKPSSILLGSRGHIEAINRFYTPSVETAIKRFKSIIYIGVSTGILEKEFNTLQPLQDIIGQDAIYYLLVPDWDLARMQQLLSDRNNFILIPYGETTAEQTAFLKELSPAKINDRNPVQRGSGIDIVREAAVGEYCLGVKDYAAVIGDLILSSQDEFCMALFGKWGRGKTFLMKRVAEYLDNQNKVEFQTIWFSAWKYPTTPELWIHLFEKFVEKVKMKSFLESAIILFKANLFLKGGRDIFLAFILASISLLPFQVAAEVIVSLISIVSIPVFLLAIKLYFVFRKLTPAINKYSFFQSHKDELGLQASLGDELHALFKAWFPSTKTKSSTFKERWPLLLVTLSITIFLGNLLFLIYTRLNIDPSSGFSLGIAFLIFFSLVAALVIFLFSQKKEEKIMLIVDDLDRCELSQMLHIIESLKLFLDDPFHAKNIKIIMLIDEDVFERAVLMKYQSLIDLEDPDLKGRRRYIKYENLEKFFLIHLRLPDLNVEEIEEIARSFVMKTKIPLKEIIPPTTAEPALEGVDTSGVGNQINGINLPNVPNTPGLQGSPSPRKAPSEPISSTYELFTDLECALIPEILKEAKEHFWGPRSIRSFLFKYFILRELCRRRGFLYADRHLIESLRDAIINPENLNNNGIQSSLATLIRQVY